MIDLVSTNTTDVQAQRSAHLLAAVVAQAIRDSCRPVIAPEFVFKRNSKLAHQAVSWILEEGGNFDAYCTLIGVNSDALRKALVDESISLSSAPGAMFNFKDRQVFKQRVEWHRQDPRPLRLKSSDIPERKKKKIDEFYLDDETQDKETA